MSGAGICFGLRNSSLRGDLDKARHVLDEAYIDWRVPPAPAMPTLGEVRAQFAAPTVKIAALSEAVDIIIPVFNGPQHLARLFATLFDRTDPKHRFLLADDASSDPAALALLQAAVGTAERDVLARARSIWASSPPSTGR